MKSSRIPNTTGFQGSWMARTVKRRVFNCLFAMVAVLPLYTATAADAEKDEKAKVLQQLLTHLDAEPLAAAYSLDARTIPEKFAQTSLHKMLHDPSYKKGLELITAMINQGAGAEVAALWPDISKALSGPAVMALIPIKPAAPTDADYKVVLLALTPDEKSAAFLNETWTKFTPQKESFLSQIKFQPVVAAELKKGPAPAWAQDWPADDLCLKLQPQKLGDTLDEWAEKKRNEALELVRQTMMSVRFEEISKLALAVRFQGETFIEELNIEVAPHEKSTYGRVVNTIREDPAAWDALTAATPGEHDLILLGQCNFNALDSDLPFAAQAMERYLRGKKWTRGHGKMLEALNPQRFSFLLDRLQGSFAAVGKPALSGELRLTVTAAMKADPNGADAIRENLVRGMKEVGADFEPIPEARKIGNSPPLGAKFQGRGLFGAPIVAMSAGWLWICSSSPAYQELTQSFKTGRTVAAEFARDRKAFKEADKPDPWRAEDSVRIQMNLDKIISLAYAAWLLAGDQAPAIGEWKIPGDLLPQPQMFNGRLGVLRTGLIRKGNTLTSYSQCNVPLSSLLLPIVLQESAETIEVARVETEGAKKLNEKNPGALKKNENAEPAIPDTSDQGKKEKSAQRKTE